MPRFLAKKRPKRTTPSKFYIFVNVEKTEYQYFCHLSAKFSESKFTIIPIIRQCPGATTITLIDSIIKSTEYRNRDVWDTFSAVFDIDECTTGWQSTIDTITLPAIKKARTKWIKCFYCNPSFELWILLHFRKPNAGEQNWNQAKILSAVETVWKRRFSDRYVKSISRRRFDKLFADFPRASDRASGLTRVQYHWRDEIIYKPLYCEVHELINLIQWT